MTNIRLDLLLMNLVQHEFPLFINFSQNFRAVILGSTFNRFQSYEYFCHWVQFLGPKTKIFGHNVTLIFKLKSTNKYIFGQKYLILMADDF